MLNTIEPQAIRVQEGSRVSSSGGADFTALLQSVSPVASAGAGMATNNAGISAVTHAAVTGVAAAPGGAGAYHMGGSMGIASPAVPAGGLGIPTDAPIGGGGSYYGGTGSSGLDGMPTDPFLQQDYLLNKMRDTNMQMLTLQAAVQQENRDWTTRSQILKAKHDTEMAQVRNLRVS